MIILPTLFLVWINRTNKPVKVEETDENFYYFLNEDIELKHMPFVLGLNFEYSKLKYQSSEQEMDNFYKEHKSLMPDHIENELSRGNKNAIGLLYAYLSQNTLNSKEMKSDIKKLLKLAPAAINEMFIMAFYCTKIYAYNKRSKYFGVDCIRVIFQLSQILHQRSPVDSTDPLISYLQLPHFDLNRLEAFKNNYVKDKVYMLNIPFLQSLDNPLKKRCLGVEIKDEKEFEDIENTLDSIPLYDLKVEYFTEGFDEVVEGDFMTIKVTVHRKNLEEGKVGNNFYILDFRSMSFTFLSFYVHRKSCYSNQ